MIAVMVLGIGLVGVGALVSVGALQAMRASVDDHKAILGRSGVTDRMVRGFCHAEAWMTAAGSSYMQTVNGVPSFPADSYGNSANLQAVAIDPLMVGAFGAAVGTFATNGSNLSMPRLTLSSLGGVASQQACISEDDMLFAQSTTDPDVLPTGGYNSVGTKREFVAQYSWMATLVPAYGDLQPTDNRNLMTMSIVVFNQRQFSISPLVAVGSNPPSERSCQVTAVSGSGYGGGDLTLSSTSQIGLNLRVGECLMLGWMQTDVPADPSSGKATAVLATAKFGTLTRSMYRWYRILNAGPATGSGSSWTRNITVGGTDLNLSMISPNSMYAFIYDGAVAVYERTVRLEGPSMWTY